MAVPEQGKMNNCVVPYRWLKTNVVKEIIYSRYYSFQENEKLPEPIKEEEHCTAYDKVHCLKEKLFKGLPCIFGSHFYVFGATF